MDASDLKETINRINKLNPDTKREWGKMTVGQILAHVNVGYEMAYEGLTETLNFPYFIDCLNYFTITKNRSFPPSFIRIKRESFCNLVISTILASCPEFKLSKVLKKLSFNS